MRLTEECSSGRPRWLVPLVLFGTCVLTLLNSTALLLLLLRLGELNERLAHTDHRLLELSAGPSPVDVTSGGQLQALLWQGGQEGQEGQAGQEQRSRGKRSHGKQQDQHGSGHQLADQDTMMMVTYSMIPVR